MTDQSPPVTTIAASPTAIVKLRCLCRRYGPRKHWPDTLGVTIPVHIRKSVGWTEYDEIRLRVTNTGRILIEKVEDEERRTEDAHLGRALARVDATHADLEEQLADLRRQLSAASAGTPTRKA